LVLNKTEEQPSDKELTDDILYIIRLFM